MAAIAISHVFLEAAHQEEERSKNLAPLPTKDANGQSLKPGDTVEMKLGESIFLGTVHTGRSSVTSNGNSYLDLEVELNDGRRVGLLGRACRKLFLPKHTGKTSYPFLSEHQRALVVALAAGRKIIRSACQKKAWTVSEGKDAVVYVINSTTLTSMQRRGIIDLRLRLTTLGHEIGKAITSDL